MKFIFRIYVVFLFQFIISPTVYCQIPSSARSENAIKRNAPILEKELKDKGLKLGSPIFIRIFKEESELELWIEGARGYELFNLIRMKCVVFQVSWGLKSSKVICKVLKDFII